jgi:hypothetical protein
LRDKRDPVALRASRALLAFRVLLVSRVSRGLREIQVSKVKLVFKGILVFRVRPEHKDEQV